MALYTDKMDLVVCCGGNDFSVGDKYAVAVYGTLFGKTGWFWDGHKKQQAEDDNMEFVAGYINVEGFSQDNYPDLGYGRHCIVIDGSGYYVDETGYIGTIEKIAVYEDYADANWGNVSVNATFRAYDNNSGSVKYSKTFGLTDYSYGYNGGGHWVIINKTVDLYIDVSNLTLIPTVKVIPVVASELEEVIKQNNALFINKLQEKEFIKEYINPVYGVEYPLRIYDTVKEPIHDGLQIVCYDDDRNYYDIYPESEAVRITFPEKSRIPDKVYLEFKNLYYSEQ